MKSSVKAMGGSLLPLEESKMLPPPLHAVSGNNIRQNQPLADRIRNRYRLPAHYSFRSLNFIWYQGSGSHVQAAPSPITINLKLILEAMGMSRQLSMGRKPRLHSATINGKPGFHTLSSVMEKMLWEQVYSQESAISQDARNHPNPDVLVYDRWPEDQVAARGVSDRASIALRHSITNPAEVLKHLNFMLPTITARKPIPGRSLPDTVSGVLPSRQSVLLRPRRQEPTRIDLRSGGMRYQQLPQNAPAAKSSWLYPSSVDQLVENKQAGIKIFLRNGELRSDQVTGITLSPLDSRHPFNGETRGNVDQQDDSYFLGLPAWVSLINSLTSQKTGKSWPAISIALLNNHQAMSPVHIFKTLDLRAASRHPQQDNHDQNRLSSASRPGLNWRKAIRLPGADWSGQAQHLTNLYPAAYLNHRSGLLNTSDIPIAQPEYSVNKALQHNRKSGGQIFDKSRLGQAILKSLLLAPAKNKPQTVWNTGVGFGNRPSLDSPFLPLEPDLQLWLPEARQQHRWAGFSSPVDRSRRGSSPALPWINTELGNTMAAVAAIPSSKNRKPRLTSEKSYYTGEDQIDMAVRGRQLPAPRSGLRFIDHMLKQYYQDNGSPNLPPTMEYKIGDIRTFDTRLSLVRRTAINEINKEKLAITSPAKYKSDTLDYQIKGNLPDAHGEVPLRHPAALASTGGNKLIQLQRPNTASRQVNKLPQDNGYQANVNHSGRMTGSEQILYRADKGRQQWTDRNGEQVPLAGSQSQLARGGSTINVPPSSGIIDKFSSTPGTALGKSSSAFLTLRPTAMIMRRRELSDKDYSLTQTMSKSVSHPGRKAIGADRDLPTAVPVLQVPTSAGSRQAAYQPQTGLKHPVSRTSNDQAQNKYFSAILAETGSPHREAPGQTAEGRAGRDILASAHHRLSSAFTFAATPLQTGSTHKMQLSIGQFSGEGITLNRGIQSALNGINRSENLILTSRYNTGLSNYGEPSWFQHKGMNVSEDKRPGAYSAWAAGMDLNYRRGTSVPLDNNSSGIMNSSPTTVNSEIKLPLPETRSAEFNSQEIKRIADRVYREVQQRMKWERQRRGL